MKDKSVAAIVILLLAILSLVLVYSTGETGDLGNKTELNVYSEGPIPLRDIIGDVQTTEYYKGYDNQTLSWMESLGEKQVFSGDGIFVVMDDSDAGKLRSEYVCDAYIVETMECTVLENRSLGDIEYQRDILLVKDVKYLGEEIHYLAGS